MSRRIQAPPVKGAQFSTRWFYERARGQYANEFYRLSLKQREAQQLLLPKSQLVSKLDVARVILCGHEMPFVVAQGAQRMIMEFSKLIRQQWDKDKQQFNDQYYRDRIAELIVYRRFEARVVQESWYLVGYKAIIVAYALSWFARHIHGVKRSLDLTGIWKAQDVPKKLLDVLITVGHGIFSEMQRERDGKAQNVTQLAKRQTLWERLKGLEISLPDIDAVTIKISDHNDDARAAKRQRAVDDGIEAQRAVVDHGSKYWGRLREWFEARGYMEKSDRAALNSAASEGSLPSERQALRLLALKALAEKQGFLGAGY
jgi:hypothetical protein